MLTGRFTDALAYAVRLHASQTRKGTATPYIAHLMAVAGLALEYGATEDEAIAALLHDAVEDQGGAETREEIRRRFGEDVAGIVDECSDTDQQPKPPWRARKEAHLNRLRTATESVRLIVAADKLHNARTLLADWRAQGEAVWDRFTGGREGTLWYYRSLVELLRSAGATPMVEELARVVAELEHLVGGDAVV